MDEAEPEKQRSMLTKSSIKRKPLADLSNIVRKPNHTSSVVQSKKPVSSNASDSSIGSTQNLVNLRRSVVVPSDEHSPAKHQRLKSDENQTGEAQRRSTQSTRSKSKADVSFYQSSFQERRNNVKERSVSFLPSHHSSTEKTKDKRKSSDVPASAHHMKKENNSADTPIPHSTEKLKDKGKDNAVQSGCSFTGNANCNMGVTMPDSLVKRRDKGKAIAEPPDYSSRKKLKNNMMEFGVPLKGVVIKEREGKVLGSSSVNLAQKDKGKGVSTLEKKDQQSSCPPILRTMSNRNDADGTEDALQYKLQTEPPLNKKKKRCSTKEVKEEFTLPQDFVEQQRAYFKEIDDFELQVEEV